MQKKYTLYTNIIANLMFHMRMNHYWVGGCSCNLSRQRAWYVVYVCTCLHVVKCDTTDLTMACAESFEYKPPTNEIRINYRNDSLASNSR